MKTNNLNKLLRESLIVHQTFDEPNIKNGAEYTWQHKPVLKSVVLYDGTTLDHVSYKDCEKVYLDNKRGGLNITNSTDVEGVAKRPWPSVTITINQEFQDLNRLRFVVKPIAIGYENFYIHFVAKTSQGTFKTAFSVTPNIDNNVLLELDEEVTFIESISICPWLTGTPPEALPKYELILKQIVFEKVKLAHVFGWNTEEIAFSHAGYFIDSEKQAISSIYQGETFEIIQKNKRIAEFKVKEINDAYGKFYLLDFTSVKEEGIYQIKYGEEVTKEFRISSHTYDAEVVYSLNFLRSLRCGEAIDKVHSACHLNCKTIIPATGQMVPNFGGWHDAGDVSQFEIPTAEMAEALLDLSDTYQDIDKTLAKRINEEAKVGIDWLLRTRFNNGMRALAVTYSIWRSDILRQDNKSVYQNVAENGPFENFLSSAALAKAYFNFKDDDVYRDWCLRAAIDDYNFAIDGYQEGKFSKRWGPCITSVTCGVGILAATLLYQATKDNYYLLQARLYAELVMSCQETEYVGEEKKIRGFFYEDIDHQWLLTYEHRGHEQSPIQGLVELCKILPNSPDYHRWMNSINLYVEYVKTSLKYSPVYGLLPGHLYLLDKINIDRFTCPAEYGTREECLENLKRQARNGIKFSDNIYLRIFPVAIQRRGFHATLLSKVKAISEIYSLTKDPELKQIIINQLEWIMGKNPFNSSTMYGVGYNYHPLYVAFSRQMVGSLPVGIMTKGDTDIPYWPQRDDAVYKEIWGHTTGKFLWVLADLLKR